MCRQRHLSDVFGRWERALDPLPCAYHATSPHQLRQGLTLHLPGLFFQSLLKMIVTLPMPFLLVILVRFHQNIDSLIDCVSQNAVSGVRVLPAFLGI